MPSVGAPENQAAFRYLAERVRRLLALYAQSEGSAALTSNANPTHEPCENRRLSSKIVLFYSSEP